MPVKQKTAIQVLESEISSKKVIGQLKKALPSNIDAVKYARGVITTIMMDKKGKLRQCTPTSIIRAILTSAQIGLNVDANGHAYLVPYRVGKTDILECQLIPGFKGWIFKARQSPLVADIYSGVAYKNETFEVQGGTDPRINHIHNYDDPDCRKFENIKAVYSVIVYKSGIRDSEVMSWDEVLKIKAGLKYKSDIWEFHPVQMGIKTVIRRHAKRWQLPQLDDLESLDNAVSNGHIISFDEKGQIQKGAEIKKQLPEGKNDNDQKEDLKIEKELAIYCKEWNIPPEATTQYMIGITGKDKWPELSTSDKRLVSENIQADKALRKKYAK